MYTQKLHAGDPFPSIKVTREDGQLVEAATAAAPADWRMLLVYRGRHCPMCTRYLNLLAEYVDELAETGVDILAVSADSEAQLLSHRADLPDNISYAYGLTEEQMHTLGLYMSAPRSAQETDHNFAEPGLFIINQHGQLHVVDISNNPFVRPDIATLVRGLKWIRDPDNHYPIRGTASR